MDQCHLTKNLEVRTSISGEINPDLGVFRQITEKDRSLLLWIQAIRPHHAAKCLLVFVPLILAHQWNDWSLVSQTVGAFLSLLTLTSASYLINDLLDVDADRKHATKRLRPYARGALSKGSILVVATILVAAALVGGFWLNQWVGFALLFYLGLTLAYSLSLKRVLLVDTFAIGVLFTTRIVIGSILVGPPVPVWLLAFSICFFSSLALAKRHNEIARVRAGGGDSLASRGYRTTDGPLTWAAGMLAGLASLVVLALYLAEEAFSRVGYSRPEALWVIVLLVAAWIGRVWLFADRGHMDDDPVSFALQDRWSLLIALLIGLFFVLSL